MDKAQAYAVLRIEPGCTEDNIIQRNIRKNFNRFMMHIECCADGNNGTIQYTRLLL